MTLTTPTFKFSEIYKQNFWIIYYECQTCIFSIPLLVLMSHPIYDQKNVESTLKKLSKTMHQRVIPNKAYINLKYLIEFNFHKLCISKI